MYVIKKIIFILMLLVWALPAYANEDLLCFKNDGLKLTQEFSSARNAELLVVLNDISLDLNNSENLTVVKPDIFHMTSQKSKRCPSGGRSFEIRTKHYPVVLYSSEICDNTLENNKREKTGLALSGLVEEKEVKSSCILLAKGDFEDSCNLIREGGGVISGTKSSPNLGVIVMNATSSKIFWKINIFCGEPSLNRSFSGETLK